MGISPYPNQSQIKDEVIDWLSKGLTLRDFCRQPGKPAYRAIYDWKNDDPAFAARFADARDVGFDVIADHSLQIVDEKPTYTDADGVTKVDQAGVQYNYRRAEHRLKLLAKWNPTKYGERISIDQRNTLIQLQLSGPLAERLVASMTQGAVIDALPCNADTPDS